MKQKISLGIIKVIIGIVFFGLAVYLTVWRAERGLLVGHAIALAVTACFGSRFFINGLLDFLYAFVSSERVYKIALKEEFDKHYMNMYDYMTDEQVTYCAKNCCNVEHVFYLVTNPKYEPEFNM